MAHWPPTDTQRGLLSDLARLIALGGDWRFLHAPVVAAHESDYPDHWDDSRDGVARVLARTLWHAHAGFDAVLVDARVPGGQQDALLRNTLLELTQVDGNAARFVLQHIGNDDVAGIVAHEVGRAFVGWLARDGHPFRTAPDDGLPDPMIGSVATVYLGLGVVAANAAFHSRAAGKLTGNLAWHAHAVARAGGVDVDDLAFLLAVQAEVRDDVLTALDSLRTTQSTAVEAWRAVLEHHEDELRQLLGLTNGPATVALERPAEPRMVAVESDFAEPLLTKANLGQRVLRVPETQLRARVPLGALLGVAAGYMVVGAIGSVAARPAAAIILGGAALGIAVGLAARGTRKLYRCATCESFIDVAATLCPACGGTVAGEIAHRNKRLDVEDASNAEEPGDAGAAGEHS